MEGDTYRMDNMILFFQSLFDAFLFEKRLVPCHLPAWGGRVEGGRIRDLNNPSKM
jgi:hypothetical protein